MHAGGTRADTRVTRRSEDQVADGEAPAGLACKRRAVQSILGAITSAAVLLGIGNLHNQKHFWCADRIDTSEFYQQTIFTSDASEPRVKARLVQRPILGWHTPVTCAWFQLNELSDSPKCVSAAQASQCFTKYKYRGDAASGSGGPGIVATQVQQMSRPIPVQQLELTTKPANVRAGRWLPASVWQFSFRGHQTTCRLCFL
jgi:hypothetical protein